jgi:hypothetical protein
MRLTTSLDHFGFPRFLHHRGRGNSVLFIEAPRQNHHDGSGTGQERWRAASYRDPWPDRA